MKRLMALADSMERLNGTGTSSLVILFTGAFKAVKHSSEMKADISLAPFDLGVAQVFRMYSIPSDIEGIEEIYVELERENGSPNAWYRNNRLFMNDLRNQFLLWRNLPIDSIEHYRGEWKEMQNNL